MRIPLCALSGSVVLLLVFSGCSKKTVDAESTPEPAAPVALATPSPTTPAPTPTPATPTPKRLAPAGTFYLLVKKSVETADGIIGFKPGTLVRQEADGGFSVEGHKLAVRPSEITNDLDIAAHYAGADAQRQAALRQASASAAAAAATPTPPSSTGTSSTPGARPSGPSIVPSQRSPAALQSSSALGSNHTMTKDGWLWQKDASGTWKRIKPLR